MIGAGDHATVSQWESGINVPEGGRRQRLELLLAGRLWPELRLALIDGVGVPQAWEDAARWYRRASRECPPRETAGIAIAAALEVLRAAQSSEALRQHYRERDGEWIHGVATSCGLVDGHPLDLRRVEDAAYGLRWLEIAHGLRLDPHRSLTRQLPERLLGERRRPVT